MEFLRLEQETSVNASISHFIVPDRKEIHNKLREEDHDTSMWQKPKFQPEEHKLPKLNYFGKQELSKSIGALTI